jgi:cellulose synthase/poly-beta-1,6-N-acetylglucosamine synthase-like glycosyltransferase
MVSLVSILVPARNEESILPHTLPSLVEAAENLGVEAEIIVVLQVRSPFLENPPFRHPLIKMMTTNRVGKFNALYAGADAAEGSILVLADADVFVEPDAIALLVAPLLTGQADVAGSRIEYMPGGCGKIAGVLASWASVSARAWDDLRSKHRDLRWALPGAMYALRREYLPAAPLCPLVDDASIGLYASEAGAVIDYVPAAVARTATPARNSHWTRQKLRSRRGWAALRHMRPGQVASLDRVIRHSINQAAGNTHWSTLMQAQDRVLRIVGSVWPSSALRNDGQWQPARGRETVESLRLRLPHQITERDAFSPEGSAE